RPKQDSYCDALQPLALTTRSVRRASGSVQTALPETGGIRSDSGSSLSPNSTNRTLTAWQDSALPVNTVNQDGTPRARAGAIVYVQARTPAIGRKEDGDGDGLRPARNIAGEHQCCAKFAQSSGERKHDSGDNCGTGERQQDAKEGPPLSGSQGP